MVLLVVVASVLMAQETVKAGYIKGSFIQPHLFAQWDDARWQQEFDMLRSAGMDFLIFMHTVHTGKDGKTHAVYPSALPGVESRGNDLLEMCLRNAKQAGFKVFVGLNFDERWWERYFAPEWLMECMNLGNQVAEELIQRYKHRYPETMAGWYWVWEVEPSLCKEPAVKQALVGMMNINLDYLHRETPDMPFLFSPFMNCENGTADNCAEVWKYVLENAHFQDGDIFVPQDCIGSGFLNLDVVEEWYAKMAKIIPATPKIRYWANVEMFDQRFWTVATPARLKQQMELLRPYVSGFISFAYSHYYSPLLKTPLPHAAYRHYVVTGELPDAPKPQPVRGLKVQNADSGDRMLVWNAAKKEAEVMGYHIYKDGRLLADIQYDCEGNCRREYRISEAGLYEVASYNVLAEESFRKQIKVD